MRRTSHKLTGLGRRRPRAGPTPAFTLVEMLVASTMLALITATGLAVFSSGLRSAAKARRVGRIVFHAQMALRAMAEDLRAAATGERCRMVSLDAADDVGDTDTLDFVVNRSGPARAGAGESGRTEVGYSIGHMPDGEARCLLRRVDATLDDDPLDGGTRTIAGPHVSEMDLEFYDGTSWQPEWHGVAEMPKAIRVRLVLADEDRVERPRRFTTTVRVMAQ